MAEAKKQPVLLMFRGQTVEYGELLTINQHTRTGARGDTNGQLCVDSNRAPSIAGAVGLIQIGDIRSGPTTAVVCTNCFYKEI